MKNKQTGILSELMEIKANIAELIFVAILLALAVNLISSTITLFISPSTTLLIGIVVAIIAIWYSTFRLFGRKNRSTCFEGFFIYNKERKEILSIPRYRYAEIVSSYLKSAFSENEALKILWEADPFENILKYENGTCMFNRTHTLNLITEATECFLFNELSLHLSAYFNDAKYPQKRLMKIERHDIPDVLLSNHFLELFSKSTDERPKFIRLNSQKGNQFDDLNSGLPGKIVYATGKDGAIYNRLELILPAKSKLKRLSKNSIEIDTNRFKMILTVDFRGINTFLGDEFYKYILGVSKQKNLSEFKININIDVRFKIGTFFSASGWDYYYWIDSFIERFREHFEEDSYFDSIGWKQTLTVLNYLNIKASKDIINQENGTNQ